MNKTHRKSAASHLAAPEIPKPEADPISPSYYKAGGIEVFDIADAFDLNRWEFTILKYLLRRKGDRLEDLQKARKYLDREIQRLEGLTKGDPRA